MILFKMFGAILIHNLFNTMTQACSHEVYFYSFLKAQKKEGDLAALCSRDQRRGPPSSSVPPHSTNDASPGFCQPSGQVL